MQRVARTGHLVCLIRRPLRARRVDHRGEDQKDACCAESGLNALPRATSPRGTIAPPPAPLVVNASIHSVGAVMYAANQDRRARARRSTTLPSRRLGASSEGLQRDFKRSSQIRKMGAGRCRCSTSAQHRNSIEPSVDHSPIGRLPANGHYVVDCPRNWHSRMALAGLSISKTRLLLRSVNGHVGRESSVVLSRRRRPSLKRDDRRLAR